MCVDEIRHEKRCEIVDIIGERDLDVMALTETKLKCRGRRKSLPASVG